MVAGMRIDPRKLERLRWEAGLTQRQLGERAGLSDVAVHGIESGKRRGRPNTAAALAAALDVEIAEMLADDDEPVATP